MDVSGGSGDEWETDLEFWGPPSLNISGDIIGAEAGGELDAPSNILKSVTWSFTGAKSLQNYTNSKGETLGYQPVPENFGNTPASVAMGYAYWDATPGTHTVTADFTYEDGSFGSVSKTISIAQPTVNSFTVTYTAGESQKKDLVTNGRFGLASPGISYSGSVTVPASATGGQWSFIQKLSYDFSRTDTNTTTNAVVTHMASSGGMVLDADPGSGPNGAGYLWFNQTVTVGSGSTGGSTPTTFTVDSPKFSYFMPPGTRCTSYGGTIVLQYFLVFKPDGGIWVQLARTNTVTVGGNTYTWDPAIPQFTPNAPPSPTAAGTLSTTTALGFVEWSDYYDGNPRGWNAPY